MFTRILCFLVLLVASRPLQAQNAVERAESLRNTGDFAGAVVVLREHLRANPADIRAEAMLGQTLYWQGDFSAAMRHFRRVLAADPTHAMARQSVYEIRSASAPWIRVEAEHDTDNQPLKRSAAALEAGYFLTPLWSVAGRVEPATYESNATSLNVLRGELRLSGYAPSARVQLQLMAGLAEEFVGEAELLLRAGRGVSVIAGLERDIYLHTIASLTDRVTVTQPRALLRLDRAGWIGEAGAQLDLYHDDNRMTTLYAWLLAPLFRAAHMQLQAGYAGSWQDSEETRFTNSGQYIPYFTPEQEQQHGIAASLVTWSATGARLQLNGSYAMYARRLSPGPGPSIKESFDPYEVRISGALPLTPRWLLSASAQRNRTAFYHNTSFAAQLTYRIVPRPIS